MFILNIYACCEVLCVPCELASNSEVICAHITQCWWCLLALPKNRGSNCAFSTNNSNYAHWKKIQNWWKKIQNGWCYKKLAIQINADKKLVFQCKQKTSIFSLSTSFAILLVTYRELIFLPKLVDKLVSVSQCILGNKCRSPYFSVLPFVLMPLHDSKLVMEWIAQISSFFSNQYQLLPLVVSPIFTFDTLRQIFLIDKKDLLAFSGPINLFTVFFTTDIDTFGISPIVPSEFKNTPCN